MLGRLLALAAAAGGLGVLALDQWGASQADFYTYGDVIIYPIMFGIPQGQIHPENDEVFKDTLYNGKGEKYEQLRTVEGTEN